MKPNTHLKIDSKLVGDIVAIEAGEATAQLVTTAEMIADDHGLIHGGFVFGLADYAAMLAVNDPHVVLGAAETRFVAPVAVGQTVVAIAHVVHEKGKKRTVEVTASVEGSVVMTGTFTTFCLDKHVLA